MDAETIKTGQRRIAMVFGVTQTVRVLEASDYCPRQWLCKLEPAGTTLALDETELGALILEPDETQSPSLQAVPDALRDTEKLAAARRSSDAADDAVTEASEESFPASDPPAWTSSTALATRKSAASESDIDGPAGSPKLPPR